ncbi:uncharacterized protein Triagg1_4252 [Trichoderma aggressivum f. europaeum]|uniref:DUF8035 domain-containing protein n=1 Tax=Trichoderma aggressivum f. europaeum TaxID=173218 RepID=A0AAE1IH63_9HYPO|nr:hypothetical protein Triagg1_4252 [Trichoderma aggressivum f. europaeum]
MVAMSGTSVVQHIDAVDAFARTLYVRTTQSTVPSLSADASQAVHNLHNALRDLRVEAADPDSRLNSSDSSTYSKQLNSIVKDSQTTLKQLELVLDLNSRGGGPYADGAAEGINAVQAKLVHQKTVIDAFLDLLQSRDASPTRRRRGPGLEAIKDKVDAIGRRLFRRDSNKTSSGDDKMWKKFKAELVREGFSSKVLDEHEDVLRAYIQEIESVPSMKDGIPPTVRGLLELDGDSVPNPIYARHMTFPPIAYDKTASMDTERLMPDQRPLPSLAQELSYDPRACAPSENDGNIGKSFDFISTRDLLLMDSLSSDMAGLHLSSSPTQVDAPSFQPIMSGALPLPEIRLPTSTAPQAIPQARQLSVDGIAPHLYGSSAPPAYGGASLPRLAPDSYGRDIPMHAEWTKIKRSVVSPEALHRAGVRYEARPGYVAILGHLSLDQVTHYARLSAECRAARRSVPPVSKQHSHHVNRPERTGSESSRDGSAEDDKDSERRSDVSDADDDKALDEKDVKNHPIIVNPPERGKRSSAPNPVMPKPILKNKNTNHVRFGPDPYEVEARPDKDSREGKEGRESRDSNSSKKSRDRDERDRDDHSRRREDRDRRRRDSDPSYDDKYRRDHRDRDRDRDDGYRSHHNDRDRRDDRRRERPARRQPWGEALGMVGIGGAAASLLGVLAEAAIGG